MGESTKELWYNQEMEYPLKIYQIFKDFFGENRVDLQGFPKLEDMPSGISLSAFKRLVPGTGFILVHFPHVKVTNENDKSTEMNHLFAKVPICKNGVLSAKFSLNRSEYSYLHISNGYMHSHVSQIPFGDFTYFQTPCTGSGPINHTMGSLFASFDEDLWRLFCLELDKFVQVESLTGVPYHRLESLSLRNTFHYTNVDLPLCSRYSIYLPDEYVPTIARFTKHLIDKEVLKFVYNGMSYSLGMSTIDTIIKVSNCFIHWYNKRYRAGLETVLLDALKRDGIIRTCKYTGDSLVIPSAGGRRIEDYTRYIGAPVCTFKGETITLNVTDIPRDPIETNTILILSREIIEYILTKILNIVNLRYGNSRNTEEGSSSNVQAARII